MNTLQYVMLAMAAFVIVYFPSMVAGSIRRKQWYRIFEVPLAASVVVYMAVDVARPPTIQAAPPVVHWLLMVVVALWVADWLGIFRWLFNRQKASPIERT